MPEAVKEPEMQSLQRDRHTVAEQSVARCDRGRVAREGRRLKDANSHCAWESAAVQWQQMGSVRGAGGEGEQGGDSATGAKTDTDAPKNTTEARAMQRQRRATGRGRKEANKLKGSQAEMCGEMRSVVTRRSKRRWQGDEEPVQSGTRAGKGRAIEAVRRGEVHGAEEGD